MRSHWPEKLFWNVAQDLLYSLCPWSSLFFFFSGASLTASSTQPLVRLIQVPSTGGVGASKPLVVMTTGLPKTIVSGGSTTGKSRAVQPATGGEKSAPTSTVSKLDFLYSTLAHILYKMSQGSVDISTIFQASVNFSFPFSFMFQMSGFELQSWSKVHICGTLGKIPCFYNNIIILSSTTKAQEPLPSPNPLNSHPLSLFGTNVHVVQPMLLSLPSRVSMTKKELFFFSPPPSQPQR